MEKKIILQYLRDYIRSETDKNGGKQTSSLKELDAVTEQRLFFGEQPQYFFARIECNSTGVGTSRFKGTETRRTVARDYVTDEHLYIDGHLGTGVKGLELFFLKPGQTINYYKKSDIEKVAKQTGYQLHAQSFRDLNFMITDHRLNRHAIKLTQKPFTYPIRPIMAVVSERGKKRTIGYIYEKDGSEHIIIAPENSEDGENAKKKKGCAPWMFLGFLFPPIFIVAIFVWLVKVQKERMAG